MAISYVHCVCLVAFTGWLDLWLAQAGGLGVFHIVSTLSGLLMLKGMQTKCPEFLYVEDI